MGLRARCWVPLMMAIGLVIGCTQGGPATVPVSGTITLDGNPVEGAQVTFMTDGAPRAATGVTDAQGKYQLTTFEKNDGAVAGTHKVTVAMSAQDTAGISAEDPSEAYGEAMMSAASGKPAESQEGGIPVKYANPATSDLKAEVKSGGKATFDFDLKSEGS